MAVGNAKAVGPCRRNRICTGPSAQVEGGQVVLFHESDEVMDLLHVERLSRPRGILRHSFTPHGRSLDDAAPARAGWSGRWAGLAR